MIYLDNAATAFRRPPEVEMAVLRAFETIGNAGRGAHAGALDASRLLYDTREKLAALFHAGDPSRIAFTANATEALNTAIKGMLTPEDHVISTVCEHNSVLRPLYDMEDRGMQLSLLPANAEGRLSYDQLEAFCRPNTKAVVVTHASNLTGNVTDLARIREFTQKHGLLLIVDAAQTAGILPIDVQAMGIDILCFTGHKGLLGPQGTGGIYVRDGLTLRPLKVGGSGVHSFDRHHPTEMPTALEAGTLNGHGLAGLDAAVSCLLRDGVESLGRRELALAARFADGVRGLPGVRLYGDFSEPLSMDKRVGIVTLNIGDIDSAVVADALWEDAGIAVRAGAHCAPLMHRALGTEGQGAVRFSFSHYNTGAEVDIAIVAVRALAEA